MDQLAFYMFGAAPIFGGGVLYGLFIVYHYVVAEHGNKVLNVVGISFLGLIVMGLATYWMGGVDLVRPFFVLGPLSLFAGFAVRYGVMRMISDQYRLSQHALNKLSGAGVDEEEWKQSWEKHGPLVILVFGVLCAILALKVHFDDLFGMPGEPSGVNFWHYFGIIYPSVLLAVPALRKTIQDWTGEYFFAALFALSATGMLAFFSMLEILFFR